VWKPRKAVLGFLVALGWWFLTCELNAHLAEREDCYGFALFCEGCRELRGRLKGTEDRDPFSVAWPLRRMKGREVAADVRRL